MAYDTNEERLLVKGSEQITRDLKVNRDAYIGETLDTKNLIIEDDLNVKGEAIFDDDVAIHGDLYVEGTTTTTSEAQVSSSGNYVVTRDNNATPLATGEYSGLAVNNYATGKIATITADKDGTWRISDSATATATTYTNISAYNGVYYTGLSQTTTTGPSGILTNVDADELASVVLNGSSYYHKAGNDWFGPVTLVNNTLDIGSIVTDTTLIATLNGLTKNDLVYYRSAIDKTIDASTNQPLLTRAEASDLTGGQAFTWDATNEKAVGKTIDTTVTASSNNLITSGAVKTAIDDEATARDNAISSAIATEVTNRNTAITNAVNALDVASTGGAGKYISEISETDGKISATATTMDTAPTASSTNAVTSGGVKSAIDTAESNAKNLANATGTLAIAHGGTGQTDLNNVTVGKALNGVWGRLGGANESSKTNFTDLITKDLTGSNFGGGICGGSINISATDKGIPAGWYNYLYVPHRTGIGSSDNYKYGTLYVSPMTSDSDTLYVIHYASGTVNNARVFKSDGTGTANQANKGKNGNTYSAFGSNAFNSTAFATSTDVSLKMDKTNPTGTGSFSLNRKANTTIGTNSFAEGTNTTASGDYSHAEGYNTTASGKYSHAEGTSTTSSGYYSHAEGYGTTASGNYSHAESGGTASGNESHAEGSVTTASGSMSHAEGWNTTASGTVSHVEGYNTTASGDYQHVQGKFNVANTTWAFVIGGGSSSSDRKNILAFDWDGNLHIFGDIYVHCNANGTGGTKK